jgi:hypothetical protein
MGSNWADPCISLSAKVRVIVDWEGNPVKSQRSQCAKHRTFLFFYKYLDLGISIREEKNRRCGLKVDKLMWKDASDLEFRDRDFTATGAIIPLTLYSVDLT